MAKRISYTKVKRNISGTSGREAKRKHPKSKEINITSLIDILTILLVFLIKNVSMEAQKVQQPEGMKLPSTATKEELIKNGNTVIIKVYENQILFGTSNTKVIPEEKTVGYEGRELEVFMNDEDTRTAMKGLLQSQAKEIKATNAEAIPAILIQADDNVLCRYITEIIVLCANSEFSHIYFSSNHEPTIKEHFIKS